MFYANAIDICKRELKLSVNLTPYCNIRCLKSEIWCGFCVYFVTEQNEHFRGSLLDESII